jgi:lipoteichoic acid synthase
VRVFSRRAKLWVLGSCLPVVCYALGLKAQRLRARDAAPSLRDVAALYASDLAVLAMWFALGLGVRVAATAPRRALLSGIGLQLGLAAYAAVLLAAQGYFLSTGASLDFATLTAALARLDDTRQVIASASTPGRWLGFGSVLAALAATPWLLERLAAPEPAPRSSSRAIAALLSFSVAGVLLSTALTATHGGSSELSRDPLAQLVATAFDTQDSERDPVILERAARFPRGARALERRAGGGTKNLLVVLLESTSAGATSLYGSPHDTTPFLRELAGRATVAERAYTVVPHTSKALVSSLCGLPPRPGVEMVEALDGGIPGKCLATLLGEQGYRTAFFQAATRRFENRSALVENLGFSELVSGDMLPHEGLERANYFGYEDRILLEPTRRWLAEHARGGPFFLAVLTNTPHHGYQTPRRHGWRTFTGDIEHDRYLNAVRYQDFFLRELFDALARAGVLENTLVAILGDHGEAFGEHGLRVHDDIMYEECMRIPLLVLDPGGPRGRLPGPYSQLDLAPTLLDRLGFDVRSGGYAGRSMFAAPVPRALHFACLTDRKCVARVEGQRKLVHAFGRKPDELFDLGTDPAERRDLASQHPAEVASARADALDWYRTVRALYGAAQWRAVSEQIRSEPPPVAHPRKVRFGDSVSYLGWSASKEPVTPGESVTITFYFHVLAPLPEGMRLFMFAEDARAAHAWTHRPLESMYPERLWRGGQYLVDRYHTRIPSGWLRDVVTVRGGFESHEGRLLAEPAAPRQAAVLAEIPITGRSELSEAR